MKKSITSKANFSSRLRKVLASVALITAAGVFAFGGTALAKHDHGDRGEHGGWHHGDGDHGDWHGDRDDWRGRGYGYGGPDYYYAPGPDYYYQPDPYAYYPPERGYYPPQPEGIDRFFGLF